MDKKQIENILSKFEHLKTERSMWNNSWQLIAELVNTKKANFIKNSGNGEFLNNKVFTNRPHMAMKQRANVIKSMILGDYDFKLEPVKKYLENEAITNLLQDITDIMKSELRKGESYFNKALTQSEEFDAAFGTSIIFSDYANNKLNFKCLELNECYIDEDYAGVVDIIYRNFELNVRNAAQQFSLDKLSQTAQKSYERNDPNYKVKILNVIQPIEDFKSLFFMENDFSYISLYIDLESQHIIDFEGYYEKPFVVHREGLKVGEKYGRSPSFDAISLISQTNKVIQDLMAIINRSGCPPLGTYDQNFDIKFNGNQVIAFKATGSTNPPVFNLIKETGDIQNIFQYLQDLYEQISQFYNLDRLLDFNNKTPMTATEANMRAIVRNQSLSDLFQNKIDEKYTPLIVRTFNLLFRAKKFDDLINNALQDESELINILNSEEDLYEVSYYNQVKRDNNASNINSIMSLINNAGIIANLSGDLSIFDNFDIDKIANLFKTLTFTNEIYRGQPDIRKLRQQRAEAQAQQQQQALQQEILINQSKKGENNERF